MRFILVASLFALSAFAAEASPVGEWLVHDQSARVTIRKCGPNLCGELSWSADGQNVGRSILVDLKPDGEQWTGTVVDVRYDTRYLAHISLQSPGTLRLDGCVLGGAICDGELWTRYR